MQTIQKCLTWLNENVVLQWSLLGLDKTLGALKFTHIPSPPVHQEMHGSLELSDLSTEGHTHTIWDDGVSLNGGK